MYRRGILAGVCLTTLVWSAWASAQVANVKILTDATPDYYDLPSMVRSITANWPSEDEKCWALFYWNHIARRQTAPMMVHGLACTDPIRQFNDYGYTMCSTIAGVNCSIWDALGLKTRYWDIANHTVSEVFYGGRWHIYDNSMSALYTLCDGRTIAGVEDVGKPGACAASEGKTEPGHVAKYHCLCATSANGFLTGADCARSLREEAHCFNPNALKYRSYYYDWDRGHRYILNLKPSEVYTRYYQARGKEAKYYVPNHGRDPDSNEQGQSRFHLRGNGVWQFKPRLTAAELPQVAHQIENVAAVEPEGVQTTAGTGALVLKVDGANVITAMRVRARLEAPLDEGNRVLVSTTNGRTWREAWKQEKGGASAVDFELVDEVSGAYEVLVKFQLAAQRDQGAARLGGVEIETTTQLNAKTQPRLNWGANTVYVGQGDAAGSVVVWPDLRGERWKELAVEHRNMVSAAEHPGYMGVMHAERASEDAYVVFRLDAPREITRLVYGGRMYNRAPRSRIELLHSFDGGATWTASWALEDTRQPWDVIHYETIDRIPPETRSVLVKYRLKSSEAGSNACSLFAVRMEADYRPAGPAFAPLAVTFRWGEVQADRSLVERSHTEIVAQVPHRYTIQVGGVDHPVMRSLAVCRKDAADAVQAGAPEVRAAPGEKYVPRWRSYGKNLARAKSYTVSLPSGDNWGAGDPEGKKLTDGVVGAPYAGGPAASYGLCWTEGKTPEITVDLGSAQRCAAARIHLTGYPFWDALAGEVKDEVELFTSTDGKQFTRRGAFALDLRWKDLPVNLMWPDEETMTGPVFELVLPEAVDARWVRFAIRAKRFTMTSEVEVLDGVQDKPFDLRLALPER